MNLIKLPTCCTCPLCRVKSRQRCSILTNNERAHHDQSHESHATGRTNPAQMRVCVFTSSQQALTPSLRSYRVYISTRWPRAPATPSQSQPPASPRCKLRICPLLEVLKCIIHQPFCEMLTAQCCWEHWSGSTFICYCMLGTNNLETN